MQNRKGKKGDNLEKCGPVLRRWLNSPQHREWQEKYAFVTRWSEVIGEQLSKTVSLVQIEEDVMVLAVPDSSWAQDLTLMKKPLIARINQSGLVPGQINDIRVTVARL